METTEAAAALFSEKQIKMDYFNMSFNKNYLGSSSSLAEVDNHENIIGRRCVLKAGQKEKALIALRNHSEAERRRRERINAHLATLRTLIPGTNKMDKAALLGEVINQVKELRRNVDEATNGRLVPTDIDEVKVEEEKDVDDGTIFTVQASLCCEFKHELLSDLREALEALPFKAARAEIATLGSRMVNVFVFSGRRNDEHLVINSVREALRSVLDKFYASEEFASRNTLAGKRRKLTFFSPSNSSSLGDIW